MNKNNSATMEPNLNLHHDYDEFEDDNEDTISLSNFPTHDGDDEEFSYHDSSDQDLFEFIANPKPVPQINNPANQIVFCGKIIQHKQDNHGKQPTSPFDHIDRSSSLRFLSSKTAPLPADRCSSTLSKTQSRRPPFSFGLVKFPPEMELSDMRKRQSRRPPAPMFAAVDGDREPVVVSRGCGGRGGGGRGNWGGLLRMLRSRSHLGSAFAKTSLGCISLV